MTNSWKVSGGNILQGVLQPSGSKNAALPVLAACLLTEDTVTLNNCPDIRDVRAMLSLLETLGAKVVSTENNQVSVTAGKINPEKLDERLSRKIRASILLAGPVVARKGRIQLPPPGGDVIGRRRLDTHFLVLEMLGATVSFKDRMIQVEAPDGLKGTDIHLDEPSVTATENALMAASAAKGTTVIYNAACEPNVQDLAEMLIAMGADIQGHGTNRITVTGSGKLLKGANHRICPDHIEIGSFIGLAACCRGKVTIPGVPENIIKPTMIGLGRLGIEIEYENGDLIIPADQNLEVRPDRTGSIPTIYDSPWPGFSPDLTSTAVIVATQAKGTSLIFEKMFESRMFFVDKLAAMGASLILCDPHRVVVSGPSQLHGTDVSSPDIRAGMALLTAALCAEGESTIHNVHQIQRGYSNIVERLNALGAHIEPVNQEKD
ncbi:UDP-N-acetylglucosamine 1-carboxyvinyltransferase [Candidatus Fermentibacteria bacterium]|nr:MAG: UDP-N-acetylglucosamine 1-carboxyvinyltransferase [Candidatus Fermentibacteria bacterium]